MRLKPVLSPNSLSKIIYEVPVETYKMNWIQRLKTKIKRKKHYKKVVLNTVNKLRAETASFESMCEYADFIKQMEMSMFYNNSISNRDNTPRSELKEDEYKTILFSDYNISNNPKKKTMRILSESLNVLITFDMYYSEYDEEVIDIMIKNNFGKKIVTNYHIIDASSDFEDICTYNLLHNINLILQNAMADTFLQIYKESLNII